MSNPELMDALVALAADKGVSVDTLFGALADALESAYKRMPGAHEYAWVTIDPDTFEFRVFAQEIDEDGEPIAEVGWMVLPEFQGRGLGKRAVRALLALARDDDRWKVVHAFPGVTNAPSNGICRSLGFTLVGQRDVDFAGRILRTNEWIIRPRVDLQ